MLWETTCRTESGPRILGRECDGLGVTQTEEKSDGSGDRHCLMLELRFFFFFW